MSRSRIATRYQQENVPRLRLKKQEDEAMNKIRAVLFLLPLVATSVARSQSPTGTIAGVVTDATGAALAGVRLTIINRDSGLSRNPVTSTEGNYSAAVLPPGTYHVKAEA